MDFIHPLANDYAAQFSNATPSYLKEVYETTLATHSHADMQSSWTQGGFLSLISQLLQPTHILEVGTFSGFSAMCLSEGLKSDGQLHTIELREEDAIQAKNNMQNCHHKEKIKVHIGDAGEILQNLTAPWDLVFIDADKVNYAKYYQMIFPHVKSNGLIIADNVLFHGEVLNEDIKGKNAKAIHAFNQMVINDSLADTIMLTVRDGLSLIRKK
ncbi:MAG: O-methyltransferase [Bacteroidetes bacterium]|nr:O-methyltransferase [Bacteroidota bacterium]